MDHGPSVELGEDLASEKKSKLGLKLFFVYTLVYFGFVLINTINPTLMEKQIMFGLNLAVVYGMGLIIFAIILGLAYNKICSNYEDQLNNKEEQV